MKRIRIIGVCLVAAFVMSALAVTSASATAPEFGRCLKAATKSLTNYDNAKCIKQAKEDAGTEEEKLKKGNYQWFPGPGPKNKFTTKIKAGTFATLETKGGTKVACKGETSSGLVISDEHTGGGASITFTGCETGGVECNSVGQGVGTIVTGELKGELGLIKAGETAAKDKAGLVISDEHTGGGASFAEFACAGLSLKVQGSVILPVKANSMLLTATEKFTASKGKQKPEKFESGLKETLEMSLAGGPYEQTGLAMTVIQTNEEKLEINTVV
jgi:hypothetical protein